MYYINSDRIEKEGENSINDDDDDRDGWMNGGLERKMDQSEMQNEHISASHTHTYHIQNTYFRAVGFNT